MLERRQENGRSVCGLQEAVCAMIEVLCVPALLFSYVYVFVYVFFPLQPLNVPHTYMYVRICMYVCTCLRMCVGMYVFTCVHTYVCTYIRM